MPQDCEPIFAHPRSGRSSPDWNDNIVRCQIWFIWGGVGFHGADWEVLSPLGQEVHWSGAGFGPTCLRMEIVSSGGWRGGGRLHPRRSPFSFAVPRCVYGCFWRASRISPYKGFEPQPWQGYFYYFTSRVVLWPLKLLFMWPRALGSTLSSLLNSNKDKSKLWRAAPGPDSSPSS